MGTGMWLSLRTGNTGSLLNIEAIQPWLGLLCKLSDVVVRTGVNKELSVCANTGGNLPELLPPERFKALSGDQAWSVLLLLKRSCS